jgi:hypothetical protein
MNGMLVDSNVYYLPSRAVPPPAHVEPEWLSLNARLRNAWWRFRLAISEICGILRRPRYRFTPEDYATLLDEADPIVRRRPTRPARIIDLSTARRRLRPQPQA